MVRERRNFSGSMIWQSGSCRLVRRAGSRRAGDGAARDGACQLPGAGAGQGRLGPTITGGRRGKYDALLHQLADEGELFSGAGGGMAARRLRPRPRWLTSWSRRRGAPSGRPIPRPCRPLILVWDRRRARELFEFDYRIECYTPAHKRQYGYFGAAAAALRQTGGPDGCLKAHRQQGIFEIKNLYLEAGVRVTRTLAGELGKALQSWRSGTRRRPWPMAIFRPSCWRYGARSLGCEGSTGARRSALRRLAHGGRGMKGFWLLSGMILAMLMPVASAQESDAPVRICLGNGSEWPPLHLLGAPQRRAGTRTADRGGGDPGARCPAPEWFVSPDPLPAMGQGQAGAGRLWPKRPVRADLGCQLQAGAGGPCYHYSVPLITPASVSSTSSAASRGAGSGGGQPRPDVRTAWLQLCPHGINKKLRRVKRLQQALDLLARGAAIFCQTRSSRC